MQYFAIANCTLVNVIQINGQRGMVCINLQKAFDIINRKILLKKKSFVWFSAYSFAWFLGLNLTSLYQFSSEYQN